MRSSTWASLFGLLVSIAACSDSDGAPPRACGGAECEIGLVHVATISDSADPGLISTVRSLWIQRDARGRFFLPSSYADRVLVFDSTGQLIRQIGRRGSGPGEFRRATYFVIGPGDSIFVPDPGLGRVTIIDPGLRIAEVLTVPYPINMVNADGSFLVARQIPTAAQIGYPIHSVSRDGAVVTSFGSDTPQYRPDLARFTNKTVGPAPDGMVWAASPGIYHFEQWNPVSGVKTRDVRPTSSWFTESSSATDEEGRPHPTIVGVWEDDASRLWVLTRVSDEHWTKPLVSSSGERGFSVPYYNSIHDWVLEVIDPHSAEILASRRLPDYPGYMPPTPLLVSLKDVGMRATVLDVWLPVLKPKGG